MTTALHLLLFGAAIGWFSPPLLTPMTRAGVNPRLSVGVWLAAMLVVLAAGIAALVLVVAAGVDVVVHSSAVVLCLELLGIPELTAVPGRFGTAAAVSAAVLIAVAGAVQVARSVATLRARSREHARTARLVGRSTDRPDVFVLAGARPAAFCVTGSPPAIIVTSAAVDRLGEQELTPCSPTSTHIYAGATRS